MENEHAKRRFLSFIRFTVYTALLIVAETSSESGALIVITTPQRSSCPCATCFGNTSVQHLSGTSLFNMFLYYSCAVFVCRLVCKILVRHVFCSCLCKFTLFVLFRSCYFVRATFSCSTVEHCSWIFVCGTLFVQNHMCNIDQHWSTFLCKSSRV